MLLYEQIKFHVKELENVINIENVRIERLWKVFQKILRVRCYYIKNGNDKETEKVNNKRRLYIAEY